MHEFAQSMDRAYTADLPVHVEHPSGLPKSRTQAANDVRTSWHRSRLTSSIISEVRSVQLGRRSSRSRVGVVECVPQEPNLTRFINGHQLLLSSR